MPLLIKMGESTFDGLMVHAVLQDVAQLDHLVLSQVHVETMYCI